MSKKEKSSKRMNFMMRPSLHENLVKYCNGSGQGVSEVIIEAITEKIETKKLKQLSNNNPLVDTEGDKKV